MYMGYLGRISQPKCSEQPQSPTYIFYPYGLLILSLLSMGSDVGFACLVCSLLSTQPFSSLSLFFWERKKSLILKGMVMVLALTLHSPISFVFSASILPIRNLVPSFRSRFTGTFPPFSEDRNIEIIRSPSSCVGHHVPGVQVTSASHSQPERKTVEIFGNDFNSWKRKVL